MKQYEAVIQTIEKLGGQATLAELNVEVMKIKECKWGTKTPFASIRRIVQTRPEIFKVRPGLWALRSYKSKLNLSEYSDKISEESIKSHAYYQGLLVILGNLRGYSTYIPSQDKNKYFLTKQLDELRTLKSIPSYSYDFIVRRSSTVDVLWFNERKMPNSFFEVEHSTDMQNSLIKFCDLQDFYARMVIVANEKRIHEYEQKKSLTVFRHIGERVKFLGYNDLVKQYEYESIKANQSFIL